MRESGPPPSSRPEPVELSYKKSKKDEEREKKQEHALKNLQKMVEKLGTGQEALGAMVEESKKEKQQDMLSLFEQVRYIKDTIEKEEQERTKLEQQRIAQEQAEAQKRQQEIEAREQAEREKMERERAEQEAAARAEQ